MTEPSPAAVDSAVSAERTGWRAYAKSIVDTAAQQKANDAATIAALEQTASEQAKTVTDLRAQLAALQPVKVTKVEPADFATQSAAVLLPAKLADALIRQKPGASTKRAQVEGLTSGSNPFTVAKVGGTDAGHIATDVDWQHVTLNGTDQGHLYNGLQVRWTVGAKLTDVLITGTSGKSWAPPFEPFGFNGWHMVNGLLVRVRVDGRRDDGQAVTSSGIGLNSCENVHLVGCAAHFCGVGPTVQSGIALTCWQCRDIAIDDFDASDSYRAFNLEQCAGDIVYNRPVFRRMRAGVAQFSIGRNIPDPLTVTIVDPDTDVWPIRVQRLGAGGVYLKAKSTADQARVRLVIGGQDVSADRSKLVVA